jgi:hypothetical protein
MNPNPDINHTITLSEHNIIVQALNQALVPGVPVIQAAALIQKLNTAAQDQLQAAQAQVQAAQTPASTEE